MTISEAKQVLKEAGEYWVDKVDLRNILKRTFDPTIKLACDKLIRHIIH